MPCPTVNPLNFIKTAKPMTERVHAYGAKIFSQLSGGFGRVSIPSIVGKVAVGPSPIPHRFLDDVICRELTVEEIHTYIRKFAEAAAVCKKAGFDGVEIHAVHEGYLLDQFAISFYNQKMCIRDRGCTVRVLHPGKGHVRQGSAGCKPGS